MKHCLALCICLGWLASTAWAQRPATILDHQDRIRITKLTTLSSPYRETNLSITPDGHYLYFMSLRGGQPWSHSFMTYRGDSVFDGDIWFARKVSGQWQKPRCLPLGINTPDGEDEPNITPNGKRVYYQSWNNMWPLTGGPYYVAERTGDTWGLPKGLGGGITEFFGKHTATDGMTVSPDEKTFIVVAGNEYDRPMDIYMSQRSVYGWSYCKRLDISTPGDERSVFLAADGKTLYFASDGYKGFGGLDIYKTTLNSDGTFGEVINIGAPFNTPADDYGFLLTADGMEAYFVREGNIHFADLQEADDRIRPNVPTVVHTLKGTVRDSLTWKGLKAEILLLDARTKMVVHKITTTDAGRYTVELPNKARLYDQVVVCEGYTSARRRITIEEKPYADVVASNFILMQEQAPQVAVVEPRPEPKPQPIEPKPEPKPEPKSQIVPLTPVIVDIGDQPEVPDQPVRPVPQPENVYSFDNVAENNLILLLDVSASMRKPEKLPLLKESLARMLTHMRPEDQISIIVYSGDAKVILNGTSAAHTGTILDAIDKLQSSGETRGKTALRQAYRLAETNYIPSGNNRIILATDGYFEITELYSVIKRTSKDIRLSVFSFGKLPETKHQQMEELARRGGGNYANITPENADLALLKEAKAVRKGG
ncbi:MAG: hypothetical protein OHK0039_35750 [Bacteroidia bacterium]